MSWKLARYELTGDAPLILKSAQMANPLNSFAKELKSITSKKKKVDADYAEMGRIEFYGSIYMHEEMGPVIPGNNIVAAIIAGAKKTKEGPDAKSAVVAAEPGFFALQYDGPRTVEELFADTTPRATQDAEGFRFTTSVVRARQRIISTRPIFHNWSAVVELQYEAELINLSQLTRWLGKAGTVIGLGEWRPRFGRFSVKVLTEGAAADEIADEAPAKKKKSRSLVRN